VVRFHTPQKTEDFVRRVSATVFDTNGVPIFSVNTEPVADFDPDKARAATAQKLIDWAEDEAVEKGYTPVDSHVDTDGKVSVFVAEEVD
jgi:hypothetical protein